MDNGDGEGEAARVVQLFRSHRKLPESQGDVYSVLSYSLPIAKQAITAEKFQSEVILVHASFLVPLIASTLLAVPTIEFDTKAFQCGLAIEGKTDKIKAVFNVKNSGDEPFKLQSVRPGCGCTVVKYDSIVAPGKSVKIEAEVNIKGYHSGPISKNITVASNAQNEPTVRLTIEATVQATIDISENYLNLTGSDQKSSRTIHLSSKKAELKVSDVSFKSGDNSGAPTWQSDIPLAISYKWIPTDSTRADGYRVFELEVNSPVVEKPASGEFIIKTNHPDNPEIRLRGGIQK